MKTLKTFLGAALAIAFPVLGFSAPAMAAGSYGGAGSTVSLYSYNFYSTSYLPSPPSSVPTSSMITGVNYNMSWTSTGYVRGYLDAVLCSSSTNCTSVSTYGGSTSFFNGLPASTPLYFRVAWKDAFMTGSISGGPVKVSTSATISYS